MNINPSYFDDLVTIDPSKNNKFVNAIDWGIIQAITYFDLFEYPLTTKEIHRYLPGIPASYQQIVEVLNSSHLISNLLHTTDGYYAFKNRSFIVAERIQKSRLAQKKWSQLLKFTRLISIIPFIRMVAVTGTMAMNIATTRSDIDLFVVAERNKVWTCRAFIIMLVHLLKLFGLNLCPNYIISEQQLVFRDRNIYVAHEITQMIPLFGFEVYEVMRSKNYWTSQFLPNAIGPPHLDIIIRSSKNFVLFDTLIRKAGEHLLRNNLGDMFESWERVRKIDKLNRICPSTNESLFNSDICKGHFGQYMDNTLKRYQSKLCELEGLVFDE